MNADWYSLLDKLNQALMKYTNQSICAFNVSCISNVKQDNVSKLTVLFINPFSVFLLGGIYFMGIDYLE